MKRFIFFAFYFAICFQVIISQTFTIESTVKGKWENGERVIDFENDEVFLKTFYTLWRDGKHQLCEPEKLHFLVTDNALFIDYWKKVDDAYLPECNTYDAKISPAKSATNVYAYVFPKEVRAEREYLRQLRDRSINSPVDVLIAENAPAPQEFVPPILEPATPVYRVRYWRANVDYDDKTRVCVEKGDTEDDSIYINKHILINGLVYTCVTGRGVKLRNTSISTVEKIFESEPILKGAEFMAIGAPFLRKM